MRSGDCSRPINVRCSGTHYSMVDASSPLCYWFNYRVSSHGLVTTYSCRYTGQNLSLLSCIYVLDYSTKVSDTILKSKSDIWTNLLGVLIDFERLCNHVISIDQSKFLIFKRAYIRLKCERTGVMLARKLALVLEIRRGKWIQRPIQLCKDIKRMLQRCLKGTEILFLFLAT